MATDCSLGLGYLPIIWSLFSVLAVLTIYATAVIEGHVCYLLPSISDTSTQIPESNIYSLLMNISIIIGLSNYFTRYFQCQYQAKQCGQKREIIYKYNHISLMLALKSIVGALIAVNVQSKKAYYLSEVHDAGAAIMLIFIILYLCVQTYLSYLTSTFGLTAKIICHVRLFLSVLISVASLVYLVLSKLGYQMYFESCAHESFNTEWMSGDSGYLLHVLCNSSQWISAMFIIIYVLTYFEEFQQVMLLVDCQERSPTILSYDGIGEYSSIKVQVDSGDEDNNNN